MTKAERWNMWYLPETAALYHRGASDRRNGSTTIGSFSLIDPDGNPILIDQHM